MSFAERIKAQRQAIADRSAAFTRAYKFKPGKTTILILPGKKDAEEISKEYGAHFLKDPTSGNIIAVVGDSGITYGKQCPVRDAIGEVIQMGQQRGNDTVVEKAKEWLAKPTFVTNVKIMDGVDTDNKGKIVQPEFSSTAWDTICGIFESLMEQMPDWKVEFGALIDVERTGTGVKDTRYTYTPRLQQPKGPQKPDVMDQCVDLDAYVKGKFGDNIPKALTYLSSVLGRDVTGTAIAGAVTATAIAAPASTKTPAAVDAVIVEDELDLGDGSPTPPVETYDDILDGDFIPDATPVVATKTAAPAAVDNIEDILADLNTL